MNNCNRLATRSYTIISTFDTALSCYSKFGWGGVIGQIHVPDLRVALNNSLFKLKKKIFFFC